MARRPKMTAQVVVRMDPALAAWLADDAAANGRTVAQSVRFYLSLARSASDRDGEP